MKTGSPGSHGSGCPDLMTLGSQRGGLKMTAFAHTVEPASGLLGRQPFPALRDLATLWDLLGWEHHYTA